MENEGAEIDSVLQDCLEAIASGQETLESVIRQHPQLEADLRRELEAVAWFEVHKQNLSVRPEFIRRSSRHLYAQIRKENPERKFFKRKQALNRWERKPAVQIALAVLLVVALLANTNSLVAAAQSSTPGDQFYSLKTSLESVKLALALSPARETELCIEQARQRLVELTGLALEGDLEPLEKTSAAYAAKVERAVAGLEGLAKQDPLEAGRLAERLQREVFEQASLLRMLAPSLPESYRAPIENSLHVSEQGQVTLQTWLE